MATAGGNGFTALLFAARVGDLESVRALVDAGANVNDTAADGMSGLVLATVRAYPAVATFLLGKGADPNADGAGYTALHWAAGSWETELTVTSITPQRDGEWAIVHRCCSCGMLRTNRVAGDDDAWAMMSLAAKPLAQPPFPLDL